MIDLQLTPEDRPCWMALKAGASNAPMEIVVALARIYGVADLVPVVHADIVGVSYKNLATLGYSFSVNGQMRAPGCVCRPPLIRWAWSGANGSSGGS